MTADYAAANLRWLRERIEEGARAGEVARGGGETPTFRFSVGRSYQLSYLTGLDARGRLRAGLDAELTGFEPATFTLTG